MAKKIWLGIPVIALVLGMAVLDACSSGPRAFVEDVEMLMPDGTSAVVYFQGPLGAGCILWEEDYPIADFNAKRLPMAPIVAYKTTPGEHFFYADSTNYVVMKANLEAGKRYYVRIMPIAGPLRTTFIVLHPLGAKDAETWLNYKGSTFVEFTDVWRAEYVESDNGKPIKQVRERLADAKKEPMETTLDSEWAF